MKSATCAVVASRSALGLEVAQRVEQQGGRLVLRRDAGDDQAADDEHAARGGDGGRAGRVRASQASWSAGDGASVTAMEAEAYEARDNAGVVGS